MKRSYHFLYLLLALLLPSLPACTDDEPGDDLAAPEMTADGAKDIARTTCTVAGKFNGNLNKISEYGVKYSTSNNFPTDATTTLTFEGHPSSSVTAELEGLSPNTHYYYCWYATTGRTEVRSSYGEFTTTSTAKPEFSEVTVDSIGENYMRLRCRVTEIGDQYLLEQGISYRVKSNASASFTPVTADEINENLEYTVELNDLSAATTYEVRPYAKNSSDSEGASGMLEGYGDTQTVTTENKLSPELETYDATDVTMNSARVLAMVTSAEGSYGVITERGFCYSTTSQAPTIYDKYVTVSGTELGTVFEATLTDLDQLTTYYVRPYAKNLVNWQERVGYGTAIEFTTSRFVSPQVSFTNQDDATVTTTTIALQAQIDNYYPTALQERGFIWSTDDRNISIENAKSTGNYLTVTTTDKVFSGTLTNLEPSTNYYIRAYAIYQASNETLTGLSDAVSYSTNDVSAGTFKDLTCTARTTSSLTLATGISDQGDGVLSEKGFVWRAGSGVAVTLDNCDGSQIVPGEDSYDYSATLTDLQQATGYTVRGYAKTTYNWQTYIAYSDTLYCETNDFTAATVKDVTCTAQTISTLTVESGITDLGNGALAEKGFIWKAGNSGTPTLESCDGTLKVEGTAQGAYSATLSGLSYSTEYRVRSYVKTTLDGKEQVSYSSVITAATTDLTGVTFKTTSCTAQTTSTLTVESGITDLGDGELTEKGFCWRVADGVTPTLDNCDGSQISSGTDNGSFSITISSLQSGTSYSVRAYVKTTYNWETFISYSDVLGCATNDYILATLKELTCTAQTTSTLTVETGISDLGNGTFVEKGFIWKSGNAGTPTLESCEDSLTVAGTTQSSYTATLTGLNYSTDYRIRGYVKTLLDGKTQVAYTNAITATTNDLSGATFKALTCSSQTTTSLTVESGITDLGDGELTEKGFCWRVGDGIQPTLDNCDGSQASASTTDDSFSLTISSLQSNTSYSVRAYVKTMFNWETLISYSDVLGCTTNDYVAATLKDISCTAQSTSTLTVEGGITDMGNGTLEEKGFIWKAGNSGTPALDNNDGSVTVTSTENSSYTATLTGLNYSTEYRIRGYVKTTIDGKSVTAYTNTITAATTGLTATTFTTPTCTAQTTSTLTIQTGIEDLGDGDLTEKGVCWRVADGVVPTLDNCDGSQVSASTDNSFSVALSGLSSGTTYSVRTYVKVMVNWETLIYYSDVLSASTNDFILATLKELTCTAQTTSTLTVETGISDLGNGTFVEKGFVWRIGDNYTPTISSYDGTLVTTAENNSAYTTILSGLEAGTTYSIRAYVKTTLDNQEIVAYSNTVVSTTTDYVSATMKSITCTAQTTTSLTVESGITDMGNGDFVEKGFLWRAGSSGTPTLDNCDSSVKVEGTDRSSYSTTLTGLQVGTSYRLRGYTKTALDGNTLVAYTDVITASTYDKVAATMYYISTSLEDDCKISMTGGINNLGSGDLVEKGFCWKIDASPTLESCDGHVAVKDGSDDSYSTSVDGLHYNSTYYIRAYAKTVIDGDTLVSYSSYDTRTTRSIDISYSTTSSDDYIEISMSCDDSFANKMTEWSAAIVREGDSEISLNENSYTAAQKDTETNKYVAKLTGLKANTTYVIRMRAKYNNDYYIYQNTSNISSLKGPSKGDIDNPVIK
jgi:metal-dependent HD superfamily phosphatase/phosphodiesterase